MAKKRPPINYTSREFDSIKKDLIDYAKRYYPDTFKDFNDASFGALMLDTVAYTADILSFYLDYQANESFLDTANEYDNIVKLARQQGYKFQQSSLSHGIATFFILVPASTSGVGPDSNYMPILKRGTEVSSPEGQTFSLVENVDFKDPSNDIVVSTVNATGNPTYYAVKAHGRVISGKLAKEVITIGDFERFMKVTLDALNVAEIVSVTDIEGHQYFEVDHLSQNVIYVPIVNKAADRYTVKNIMKPIVVPRRFVMERDRDTTNLQFGYGSSSELTAGSIAEAADVVLDVHGRTFDKDRTVDPTKLISSDKFGVAPSNTTLSVFYRLNTTQTSNVSSGGLSKVMRSFFEYDNRSSLNEATIATIEGSLEVTNEEPITGTAPYPTIAELKQRVKSHFFAQNRAVTKQDYVSLVYAIPAGFGSVRKCAVHQDIDSFRRNLNLYVVSSNSDGNLTKTGSTLKENLRTWINRYKMVNDTIDILDAHIINIGIKFSVVADPTANKTVILERCSRAIRTEYELLGEIGESMSLSEIYKILNRIAGVIDTTDVRLVLKTGAKYSDVFYDIDTNISADGRTLFIPEDHILEIKFPLEDIEGVIT